MPEGLLGKKMRESKQQRYLPLPASLQRSSPREHWSAMWQKHGPSVLNSSTCGLLPKFVSALLATS